MTTLPEFPVPSQLQNGAVPRPPIVMDWDTFYGPGPLGVPAPERQAFRAAVAAVAADTKKRFIH